MGVGVVGGGEGGSCRRAHVDASAPHELLMRSRTVRRQTREIATFQTGKGQAALRQI